MTTSKPVIREVIVVEGKDDIDAVKAAVNATVLAVGGFSVKDSKVLKQIRYAHEHNGIIVLTDPDPAGEFIRRVIREAVPDAQHAYITRESGTRVRDGNIGVENASAQTIRDALKNVQTTLETAQILYTMSDMREWGLTAHPEASERRHKLGELLSMGGGNTKQFLRKLNAYGIARDAIETALESLE